MPPQIIGIAGMKYILTSGNLAFMPLKKRNVSTEQCPEENVLTIRQETCILNDVIGPFTPTHRFTEFMTCLLYTSDAADE